MTWRHVFAAFAALAVISACASTKRPAELVEASSIYTRLTTGEAPSPAEAELMRAREAINDADLAVARDQNQDYVNGLAHIALRSAQTAQAATERLAATAAADSLRTARLNRLVALSQAQRDSLARAQALTEAEVAVLRERNLLIAQRADSLRVVTEQQAEQLNAALMQLRTLVVEITNLRETARGLVISLSDVLFDVDKATLRPGAHRSVERIAAVLDQYPEHQIAVEGHTDATGPDEYNQGLSEQRAATVRTELISGGVDSTRITSRGFGESQPVATNATSAGRQQNRRVEIIVLGAGTLAQAAVEAKTDTVPPAKPDSTAVPPR